MIKKILLLFIVFSFSCKPKSRPLLDDFISQLRTSNRMVFWFNGRFPNEMPFTKILNKRIDINEFGNLMEQNTTADTSCHVYEGTITLYSKLKKVGFVEFNNLSNCSTFFFHNADTVVQYHIPTYCAMYIEGVRQGQK